MPTEINNESQVTVKIIKKSYTDKIQAGILWFKFISSINNIHLTERQVQLLAFINYRGTISSSSAKEEFCRIFDSSTGTISNMVSELLKLTPKLIIKDKSKKVRINPSIQVDFDKSLVIKFHIDKQVIPQEFHKNN